VFFDARHVESFAIKNEKKKQGLHSNIDQLCTYAPTEMINLSYLMVKGVPEAVRGSKSISEVDSASAGLVAGICKRLRTQLLKDPKNGYLRM
jgi:hypothetical protein